MRCRGAVRRLASGRQALNDALIDGGDLLDVSAVQVLGTALTETSAGYLAAGIKKLFDVASPVLTAASVNQTGDSYARLGAPAGASVSARCAARSKATWTTSASRGRG